jgi:RNA-directed DNA polymerase
VVDLREEKASLDFLGYTFRWYRDSYGRDQRYLNVGPSKKALQRERDRINELMDRRQGGTPLPRLIDRLNRQTEGWANYFSLGYPRDAFRNINWHFAYRLANHLKHHRRQRPYHLPEGVSLYEHLQWLGLKFLSISPRDEDARIASRCRPVDLCSVHRRSGRPPSGAASSEHQHRPTDPRSP